MRRLFAPAWLPRRCAWRTLVIVLLCAGGVAPRAGEFSDEFDRLRFKDALKREIAFRVAAIQVAWGAEPLCDDTSEIEPFVLWSVDTVRRRLSSHQRELFLQATGMDEKWRIVWLDESAPEGLKFGDVVAAVNDRPLPKVGSTIELSAMFRGGSTLAVDDKDFWAVMQKAREEANTESSMTLTLDGGRKVKVATQTGCAGAVMATAFDNEPEHFLRQEGGRVKLPGNALNAASSTDEFRWLAAFGTYFIASESSIIGQQKAESMNTAFTVGKVLALAVPGMGTVLSAVESKAEREIMVDSLVGRADLFADEVVMALGGNPQAGLRLSDRLQRDGTKADVLPMSDFRRSNVEQHVQQLTAIARAREAAEKGERKEMAAPDERVHRPPAPARQASAPAVAAASAPALAASGAAPASAE